MALTLIEAASVQPRDLEGLEGSGRERRRVTGPGLSWPKKDCGVAQLIKCWPSVCKVQASALHTNRLACSFQGLRGRGRSSRLSLGAKQVAG